MVKITGSNRVIRGGSWNNNAQNLRSGNRNNDDPGNRNNNVGFRLVSTLQNGQKMSFKDYICVAKAMSRSLFQR